MNRIVTPNESAHWYAMDGSPVYEVPNADGTGTRATTLRDARKLGLVPSVTTILKTLAQPGLESWKQEQLILSALTMTFPKGSSADENAKKILEDSQVYTKAAAERGNQVHAYIEDYLAGRIHDPIPGLEASLESARKWIDENIADVLHVELPIAHGGYGGRIDLVAKLKSGPWAVIDWKSKNLKKPQRESDYYSTWAYQLSAYADAIDNAEVNKYRCGWIDDRISVVIGTNPDCQGAWSMTWPREKHVEHKAVFYHLLAVWQTENNYYPGRDE